MTRKVLEESRLHPAIREKVASVQRDIVDEVARAVESNRVVVVGMSVNPHCRRARKVLTAHGVAHEYLEYGGYLGQWRRRNALKMWTGWPTFPMVFVDGALVGGANEVTALLRSGELKGSRDG